MQAPGLHPQWQLYASCSPISVFRADHFPLRMYIDPPRKKRAVPHPFASMREGIVPHIGAFWNHVVIAPSRRNPPPGIFLPSPPQMSLISPLYCVFVLPPPPLRRVHISELWRFAGFFPRPPARQAPFLFWLAQTVFRLIWPEDFHLSMRLSELVALDTSIVKHPCLFPPLRRRAPYAFNTFPPPQEGTPPPPFFP